MPQPRPALRRAPDAGVHPATVIPLEARLKALPDRQPGGQAPAADAGPSARAAEQDQAGKKAKGGKKAKSAKKDKGGKKGKKGHKNRAPATPSRFPRAGGATSDAVLLEPDRRAPLNVMIPLALRDRLREVAKMSGARQDDLVSELLAAGLSDARRW